MAFYFGASEHFLSHYKFPLSFPCPVTVSLDTHCEKFTRIALQYCLLSWIFAISQVIQPLLWQSKLFVYKFFSV